MYTYMQCSRFTSNPHYLIHMIKNKLIPFVGVAVGIAVLASSVLIASASTHPVATCSGTVAGSTIVWSSTATGGTAPYTYAWSGPGINGTTTQNTSATTYAPGTFTATVTVRNASTTASSTIATCSATVASSPAPAPLPPFFKSPHLVINPGGQFTARGMIVTSVASTSFTGTVWGTTWTVNFTPKSGEALHRDGKSIKQFDLSLVKVGDEVGVSGKIDTTATLTVNAKVLRNYSLSRTTHLDREKEKDEKNNNKHKEDDRDRKSSRGDN